MPLHFDRTLTMHAQPSGPAVGSANLKRGILVRLTEESLDALSANIAAGKPFPDLEINFTGTPAMKVADQRFNFDASEEKAPHELYCRTINAARPSAPSTLKMYANVTGTFRVQQTEVGTKVREQLRDRTALAEQERAKRHTIVLDTPPTVALANGKKRKVAAHSSATTSSRKPVNSEPQRYAQPVATTVTRAEPVPPRRALKGVSDEQLKLLRDFLLHRLAIDPTSMAALLEVAETRFPGDRQLEAKVRAVISEIATEDKPSNNAASVPPSARMWRVLPTSCVEAQPFEYPGLSELEQRKIVRSMQYHLHRGGIDKSHPGWLAIVERETVNSAPLTNGHKAASSAQLRSTGKPLPTSSSAGLPQNANGLTLSSSFRGGVMAKDTKQKKPTAAKPGKEMTPADASALKPKAAKPKAAQRDKQRDIDADADDIPLALAARAGPPTTRPSGETQSLVPKASSSKLPPAMSAPSSAKPRDPRDSLPNSTAGRTDSSAARPANDNGSLPPSAKKAAAPKATPDMKARSVVNSTAPTGSVSPLKRKRLAEDGGDGTSLETAGTPPDIKKRKSLGGSVASAAPQHRNGVDKRDARGSSPAPLKPLKIKKEERPEPLASGTLRMPARPPEPSPPSSSSKPRGSSKTKERRATPVFTSDEDDDQEEGEVRARRNRPSKGAGPKHASSSSSRAAPTASSATRRTSPRPPPRSSWRPEPLPADHARLRARYAATYVEYTSGMHKIAAQRHRITQQLGREPDGDGDVDMLDTAELQRLVALHAKVVDELKSITAALGIRDRPGAAAAD